MKTKGEDNSVQGIAYDIPTGLHKALSGLAKKNGNTMKKELILAIEEHLDGSLVRLDPTNKDAIEKFAEKNGFTMGKAVNYLVSTKISVMEWMENNMIEGANKAYEDEISQKQKAGA